MNGFAALDIPPCRRYVVVKATAGFAVCRLILKLLLLYSCLDFTQNLGKTHVGKRTFLCGVLPDITGILMIEFFESKLHFIIISVLKHR